MISNNQSHLATRVSHNLSAYCIKKDNLPTIPSNLLHSLDEIQTFPLCFASRDKSYASYQVPNSLHDFLSGFFDHLITPRYQVISQQLPIHTDNKPIANKIVYLIKAGGYNVKTRWWDDVVNPNTKLHEYEMQELQWYHLVVNVPHDTSEISSPRIAIQVI